MPPATTAPLRGEIWMLNFDPIRGHEQAGRRPALVLSVDVFNSGPASLVIVCPLSSRQHNVRSHVEVLPPEGGLTLTSYIMTEHIRSVSKERMAARVGAVTPSTLEAVEERIRILLNL